MESALSSLILFTVGIFAALTLSVGYMEMQDSLWQSEQLRQSQNLERARTDIAVESATSQSSGSIIQVTLRNTGQVKLADFDRWDVIAQYYSVPKASGYHITRLTYTDESLDKMEWRVGGIYVDAAALTPEVFERGILNPDEEMVIRAQVNPPIAPDSINYITISTPNGITASAHFVR